MRSFLLQKLKSDASIVWLSQIFSSLVAILLGKIIAVYYAASDFGHYSLVTSMFFLYTSIFFNPLQQYFARKIGQGDKIKLLAAYFWGLSIFNIIFFFIPFLISFYIFHLPFFECVFLLLFSIGQSLISIFSNFSNIERKYYINSAIVILPILFNIILVSIFYIIGLTDASHLIMSASVSSFIVSVIISIIYFHKYNYYNILKSVKPSLNTFIQNFSESYRFAIPLSLLAIFNWFLSYFDRYIINAYMEKSDVGIYAANYGLASKLLILSAPAMVLLRADIYGNDIVANDKRELILKTISKYLIVGSILVLVIVFQYKNIGSLFLSAAYTSGFFILIPISISYVLLSCTQFFDLYFYYSSKTLSILAIYGIGMILNVLFSLILIPSNGLWGACLANLISYSSQFFFAYFLFKRLQF